MKRFPFKLIVRPRMKLIITGKLSEAGDEKPQQCGWLKDKYGLSWQIVPRILVDMLNDPDAKKSQRVMAVMLKMKKIDIETLKQAYAA